MTAADGTIAPHPVRLVDGQRWLRVADRGWVDPLDASFAARAGGRWNPPRSFPTLYLSEDLTTAKAQVARLLDGFPAAPEDLDEQAPFVLVVALLPRRQRAADAVTDAGLGALGLPASYPRDEAGELVGHERCQPVGVAVRAAGLRGVLCRSAATPDGTGRELAWFRASRGAAARQAGGAAPFARWWWADDLDAAFGG